MRAVPPPRAPVRLAAITWPGPPRWAWAATGRVLAADPADPAAVLAEATAGPAAPPSPEAPGAAAAGAPPVPGRPGTTTRGQ